MNDLEKFQNQKRKASLFETIFSPLWHALEDLWQAMSGAKKTNNKGKLVVSADNQISVELDKFENEGSRK